VLRFGLDFGTSNTVLAVSDGGRPRLLPLDPVAGEVLPSVLYVRRDGSWLVGRPAIDAYLDDNAARGPVRRQPKLLGVRVASSDPEQPVVEAHILADVDAPGRLFQSLKTFLGDPLLQTTSVFGSPRGLSELIAVLLSYVSERARALTGTRVDAITLGRPVRFIGGPDVEQLALERLRTAAELAGFREIRFEQEPIAASRAADVPEGVSLVFDFGGGTLDLCLVRRRDSHVEVLATAGRTVGGDRLTEMLIDEHVAPRLGSQAEWGPKRLRLPAYLISAMHDWHALSSLNEKPLLDALDDLVRAGAPRRELEALRSAIELQLGYEIFAIADAVKCRLSLKRQEVLTYHRAAVDVDALATRFRFEQLAGPLLREADSGLIEVVSTAGVSEDEVREVVCTGGSSAVPAARALLERRFPQARLRDADPFTSVAAGLALEGALV
jgi:hypothetical chaperone protein